MLAAYLFVESFSCLCLLPKKFVPLRLSSRQCSLT
uniref:Uncharacterized protein n=1 Tax=Rhizophora mucronata TaxID=61149 RepID=A0A2P2QVQ5_RHIMU